MLIVGGYLLVFGCLLISVIYFTMLERKIMSYMQLRKGPKKVFFLGLLTPICDSVKLFFKGFVIVLFSNEVVFLFSPLLSVFFLMVV
jgi:NADH-ubiquinone oxidoreductase chain 1